MTPTQRPRIRTLEEFRMFAQAFRGSPPSHLGVPPGFALQGGDVVIATYPKCGTTWVQQIVHGLRTGGSMDFEEISLVVPWIETAGLLGIDLGAPQVATPRAFKSHLRWDALPRGGRNIFITRDPGDTLVSFFHFQQGMFFEGDAIGIEDFAFEIFLAGARMGRYWDHLASWWQVRDRDDVLFLCFEDMKDDLRPVVARIAEFCGIEADDDLVDRATRQATFEFMSAHSSQFDDHPTTGALMKLLGFPPANTSKIRAGRVGDRDRELSPRVRAALDEAWHEDIAGPLGLSSYAELRAALGAGAG